MFDRQISLGFASAATLWVLGFSLIVLDFFGVGHAGELGIGMCCGGAVLMIRCMMCKSVAHLERTVFQLGREVGRAEHGEVPLQRVR